MAQTRAERENSNRSRNDEGAPATARQKAYLKKLRMEIPANLTKKYASNLVDEPLESESEEDSLESYRAVIQGILV